MKLPTAKQKHTTRNVLVSLLIVVLIAGGYTTYAFAFDLWPFTAEQATSSTPGKDNPNKTVNEDDLIKDGGNTSQGSRSTAGTGVSDTKGEDVTSQSGGVKSDSGAITLYTPVSGQKLTSGIEVKGVATVSEVQYRISDDIHGQIGQGVLTVHNGFFSGDISIIGTDATSGTFEVYNFNNQGQEINNINIPVKY